MTPTERTNCQAAEESPPIGAAVGQDVPVRIASLTGAGPV